MRLLTSLAISLCLLTGSTMAQDAAPAVVDDSKAWFGSSSVLTQQTGEGIYNAICASCHMAEGVGAEGAGYYPALANNASLEFPDYAIYIVLHGSRGMPPLKGVLNDQQIADVVNYIRTSFGNEYPDEPATAEVVAETR